MSHSKEVDNELDTVFKAEEWIGKGRDYTSAPVYVMLAHSEEETVPLGFQAFYPSSSLSIENFIRFPLRSGNSCII
jgi:hypothetical protein